LLDKLVIVVGVRLDHMGKVFQRFVFHDLRNDVGLVYLNLGLMDFYLVFDDLLLLRLFFLLFLFIKLNLLLEHLNIGLFSVGLGAGVAGAVQFAAVVSRTHMVQALAAGCLCYL
jgi:hypothetical protein